MVVVLYPVFLIQKLNDVGGQGQSVSPDCPLVVVVTGRLTELLLSISGPGGFTPSDQSWGKLSDQQVNKATNPSLLSTSSLTLKNNLTDWC